MADLETFILAESRRQGCQPDQRAIRQAGIDLAGAVLTSQGLIHLPGLGAISASDFTRSLRARMPEAFTTTEDEPQRPVGNLTSTMMAEVAASRKQARITDADLARFTGVTRQHMEERRRAAQK
ncbi:hypothetical protein [Bradyrhizobium sp. 62]|uniref:hypothetical protein n=1 Tax=Bradyrhizobium sp. 62 TaxID=1043588 RepID=UPI001FF8292C|nr:hypothetical protein [Bradyrhizobium sp. 62]MCK1366430.1 hypothetical protein [Bradyrhizobium sp. 62]